MNYKFLFTTLICLPFLIYSCNDGQKPKSKVDITFIERGTDPFVDSSVLIMDFHYKDENGRHLLDSAERSLPLHMPYYKSLWDTLGTFYENLRNCRIGDSVHFRLTARQLFIETYGIPEVPKELGLSNESNILFFLRIRDQMTMDAFYAQEDSLEQLRMEEYINNTEQRKTSEVERINQYLETQELSATTLESGLTYVIIQQGTGVIPKLGDIVTINFKGALLDGSVFGSSYGAGGTPYDFELGSGEVIAGWDEAASILTVGTQAILLVPSDLGFGYYPRQNIPANSILRYDIEVLKSKTPN